VVVRHMSIAARTIVLGFALVVVLGGQFALAADPEWVEAHQATPPVATAQPTAFVPGNVNLTFTRVARGLSKPVFATHSGDGSGQLFIVEQTGRVRVIRKGVMQATPFLDLRSKISNGSERGLLGLAFHPDYRTNGKFYVNYTNKAGATVVAEYYRSATNASRAGTKTKTILKIAQPYANHNGGMLAFGPDGYLYVGMGDGGSAGDPGNRAQNVNSLLGKMLRLNVNTKKAFTVPPSNPYVGRAGHDLVWSIGLRNPWRFSFDRANGDLWIGDVGQNRYEEINHLAGSTRGRGANYGWRQLEGNACFKPATGCRKTGKTMPVAVYGHGGNCSVTGGYVYRGLTYPDLAGVYLFGDFCSGRIWGLDSAGPNTQSPVLLKDTALMISSFGEDQAGNVYVVDLAGSVYRIGDS
jgi:glucose/arabinose dehydrogenase